MGGRALRIGLVASLALNAFLAAFAITLVVTPGVLVKLRAAPALRQAARALDPTHRDAFMTLLRADGRRLRPQNQEARTLRREVWADFQGPALDPSAAKAKLAQARALTIQARAAVEDDVVDFAAGLPRDQRAALGRALYRMTPPVRRRAGSKAVSPPTPGPASPAPGSSPAPRSPG
jgi:uncharacterized membrane protein